MRSEFWKVRHGIVQAQSLYRSYRQQQIYKRIQLKRREEKEKQKREVLKKQARQKMEREQQEKAMNEAALIANLDVPGELAGVLSKEQGWQAPHMDCHITAVAESVIPFNWNPELPSDIDAHAFSKYVGVFFKNNHKLGVINKPIKDPFLQLLDVDKHSLSIFKLILRFMCDTKMSDKRKKLISDYIIQKGLQNEPLRDEIYCQIANQTWLNQNLSQIEHGWLLMANCLSCMPPSLKLNKYLLKYVSDVGFKDYKEICQHKALKCMKIQPYLSRTYPPCLLEWKAALRKANMALSAKFPDEKTLMCHVESWTNSEDFAAHQLNQRNMFDNHSGWTVVLEEGSNNYELMGYDYVLDVISEIEILPTFPVCKMHSLVTTDPSAGSQGKQIDINTPHHPDRDRKVVLSGRLPEPLPASTLIDARQNRNGGMKDEMVFSVSNPLNQRHVEEFLPALTDDSALNKRYYSRKSQVLPSTSTRANSVSLHDESMSDDVGGITLAKESRLNSRHLNGRISEIADSNLNRRYVQRQNGNPEMPLGSTSEHSNAGMSNWVDYVFEDVLGGDTDNRNETGYMENRIKGGGRILTQAQIPMNPLLQTATIPATLSQPTLMAPINMTNPIIGPAFTGIDPAQLTAAQIAVAQQQHQQHQQAIMQAYLSQMEQQQTTLVQAAIQQQQQQQQQALIQAALQQQQMTQVNQPYLVLVQPDSSVANTQLTMSTGQQLNETQLLQNMQQFNQQQSMPQNHVIMSAPTVHSKPTLSAYKGKAPPPPVYPKPSPPIVSAKPNSLQSPTSPPVILNGNSNNHMVNNFTKLKGSSSVLTSPTDLISVNTSEFMQNGSSSIATDTPSGSTETSSLSSPSDLDICRQPKVPLPAPPSPPFSVRPGTIRTKAVRVGKVIWPPPPAEPQQRREVHVGKLEINENLAQNITKSTVQKKGLPHTKAVIKPAGEDIQPTSSTRRSSNKLSELNNYQDTMKKLEKQFKFGSNAETETGELEEKTIKSRALSPPPVKRNELPPEPVQPVVAPSNLLNKETETIKTKQLIDYLAFEGISTKLSPMKRELFLTYQDVPWTLRLRKEVFSPKEKLDYTTILDLVFCQVVRDIYNRACIRITTEERQKMRGLLEIHNIHEGNYLQKDLTEQVKRIIVDSAKEFPTYFCRLFPVACGMKNPNVIYLGVNHSGVYLVSREKGLTNDQLKVVETFKFDDLIEVILRSTNILQLTMQHKGIVLYTKWVNQIKLMVDEYCCEQEQGSKYAFAKKDYQFQEPTLLNFKQGNIIKLMDAGDRLSEGWLYGSLAGNVGFFPEEYVRHMDRYEVLTTFKQPPIITNGPADTRSESSMRGGEVGFVMRDYALQHFRESVERTQNHTAGPTQWTEHDQVQMVKWTKSPIQQSLLALNSSPLNTYAVETFTALMTFMNDLPIMRKLSDVDSAMRILKLCHKYPELRDEVYCQLCKQTTCNKNQYAKSLLRGWRFFSLFAAYSDCSEMLRPYLTKYLENAAMESSPISHIADFCLKNLRKTFRYGGRKNVPLPEEINNLAEGRMSNEHTFCYSGQVQSSGIVQIKSSTLVRDIIGDLCNNLEVTDSVEIEEYTLFVLIHSGKPIPQIHRLSRDQYLLDITADLQKHQHPYEIMLQRMVWLFPVHPTGNEIYTDLIYMQSIQDYLDGYFLSLKNGALPKDSPLIDNIAALGALIHQSSGLISEPQIKDLKNLLPKPVFDAKDFKSQRWLTKINQHLTNPVPPIASKAQFISRLSQWELFGSTFFKLKSIPPKIGECWLAVNKRGVQIIGKVDHELLIKYDFNEILSTRLYRENAKTFLDMKLGNLMAQRISRLETNQCTEISELIARYIHVINRHRKRQGNAIRTPLFN